jgi:hypothetical protein
VYIALCLRGGKKKATEKNFKDEKGDDVAVGTFPRRSSEEATF